MNLLRVIGIAAIASPNLAYEMVRQYREATIRDVARLAGLSVSVADLAVEMSRNQENRNLQEGLSGRNPEI